MEYKVGDRYRYLGGLDKIRGFEVGKIYKLLTIRSISVQVKDWYFGINGNNSISCNLEDYFKKVEEPKFKIGDKLRIIKRVYGCAVGRVIEIKKVDLEENFFIDTASRKWNFTEVKDYPNELGLTIYLEKVEETQKEEKTTMDKFDKVFIELGRMKLRERIIKPDIELELYTSKAEWEEKVINVEEIPKDWSYNDVLEVYKKEFECTFNRLAEENEELEEIRRREEQTKYLKEIRRQEYKELKKEFGKEGK